MATMAKLTPQYVTDRDGRKTAVILPINEYDELIEDLQDLAALAERRDEPRTPHKDVVAKLKEDGCL